ncbi:hypothetical protein PR048_024647 [Dryococelus australis]|uniref:Uncharacterized protein n=1 Tax=Dryococelus australis TaxID=614101 RepID=A0ABQ9GP46_9NEOP|nr:hypothetical protein PR048_024647 [Dryococelus australis]
MDVCNIPAGTYILSYQVFSTRDRCLVYLNLHMNQQKKTYQVQIRRPRRPCNRPCTSDPSVWIYVVKKLSYSSPVEGHHHVGTAYLPVNLMVLPTPAVVCDVKTPGAPLVAPVCKVAVSGEKARGSPVHDFLCSPAAHTPGASPVASSTRARVCFRRSNDALMVSPPTPQPHDNPSMLGTYIRRTGKSVQVIFSQCLYTGRACVKAVSSEGCFATRCALPRVKRSARYDAMLDVRAPARGRGPSVTPHSAARSGNYRCSLSARRGKGKSPRLPPGVPARALANSSHSPGFTPSRLFIPRTHRPLTSSRDSQITSLPHSARWPLPRLLAVGRLQYLYDRRSLPRNFVNSLAAPSVLVPRILLRLLYICRHLQQRGGANVDEIDVDEIPLALKGEPMGFEDVGEGGREREVWLTWLLRTSVSVGSVLPERRSPRGVWGVEEMRAPREYPYPANGSVRHVSPHAATRGLLHLPRIEPGSPLWEASRVSIGPESALWCSRSHDHVLMTSERARSGRFNSSERVRKSESTQRERERERERERDHKVVYSLALSRTL